MYHVTGVVVSDVASLQSWILIIGGAIPSEGPVDICSYFCWLIEELGLCKEIHDGLENFPCELRLSAVKLLIYLICLSVSNNHK